MLDWREGVLHIAGSSVTTSCKLPL